MQSTARFCDSEWMRNALRGGMWAASLAVCSLVLGLAGGRAWGQTGTGPVPVVPADWSLAYSGQDASLGSVTYAGQPALQWQVSAGIGHSDWISDVLPLLPDDLYTFTVQLAGTGMAQLNVWNGQANVPAAPIQLSSTYQTVSETVAALSPNPQFQIVDPFKPAGAVNVYIANPTVTYAGPASGLPLWQIAYGGQDSTLTSVNYAGVPALEWQVTAALGHSDWISTYPPFVPGNTYKISADVAGTGTVAINAWDGNENVQGPPVALTPNYQTISENVLALAPNTVVVSPSTPQFQLVDTDTSGTSAVNVYFKNVTWTQVAPAAEPPSGVSAEWMGRDNVKVSWSAPAACSGSNAATITGYEVYVTATPFAENYASPSATVSGCGSGAATSAVVQAPGGRGGREGEDRAVYATVVALSGAGNSPPSAEVSTVQLRGYAGEAQTEVQELQTYYQASTGLFNTTGWWNAANALDAMIDYMKATGSRVYLSDVSNTFTKAVNEAPPPTPGNFIDTAYDDTQWWALTWVNAYDLTRNPAYLKMAETIQTYVTGAWQPSLCGGGVVWQTTNSYQNAVTNELFLELSARLYLETHQSVYLQWAQKELTWFNGSGLINSSGLINDGLTTTCQNNGQTTWTYNQGVILGGLAALYQATHDETYLTEAKQIANAAMTALVTSNGILMDPCSGTCTSQNPDQTQFKGIFLRNLETLYEVTGDPTYREFIEKNAASVWENDRNVQDVIGYDWAGPVTGIDQSFNASTLGSGLDALNAAAAVERRERWPGGPPQGVR